MASDKKKAVLEQQLEHAPKILEQLWGLAWDANDTNSQAGADVYDELHGGKDPLLPRLQAYAAQLIPIDDMLEHLHAEPVDSCTFTADSWHGVLAQVSGRVAAFAGGWSASVKRILPEGESASVALSKAFEAMQTEPGSDRAEIARASTLIKTIEGFREHMHKALDGLLRDGKRLKVGLDKERRRLAAEVDRQQDASSDVAGSAILKCLRRNDATETKALLAAVTAANASKRSGEAALRRLRNEGLVAYAPRTSRGVYVLTDRGRKVVE